MTEENTNVSEQVTVRPADSDPSEERDLTGEVPLSALKQEVHTYTLPEKLALAVQDVFNQKPEYSGRYCSLCNETTAHFRPRGKQPLYEKTVQWLCASCFMPEGKLYDLVKRLINRQGETAK